MNMKENLSETMVKSNPWRT